MYQNAKNFIRENYSHLEEGVETKGEACYCGREPGSCRLYARKVDGLVLFDCKSASCELGRGAVQESGSTFVRKFSPQTHLEEECSTVVELPRGYVPGVPKKALAWLYENGVTDGDIAPNKIGYDTEYERIIFPSYLNGVLTTWLGRDWQGVHQAKWMTPPKVKHSPIFESIMPTERRDIGVLVEDIPSAIRVGRHYPCWAILGTSLNQERKALLLTRMRAVGIKKLCIALDDDADTNALSMIKGLTATGVTVYLKRKHLGKDPKHMTDAELKEIVAWKS